MKERYQRVVAAAFIQKGDRILIAKRSPKAKVFPGMYELPGGKIEFGETPEEALKREIKEELDVEVEVFEPYHVFSYIAHEGSAHYVEIAFICELKESEGNIRMLDHDDIQWVTREELEKFEMSPVLRKAAEKGFEFAANSH